MYFLTRLSTEHKNFERESQGEMSVESSFFTVCPLSCSGMVVELHWCSLPDLQQDQYAAHSKERLTQQHWWMSPAAIFPAKRLWSRLLHPDYVVDGTGCHFECESCISMGFLIDNFYSHLMKTFMGTMRLGHFLISPVMYIGSRKEFLQVLNSNVTCGN